MSIGAITKQLAAEALGNQMKEVMEGLRPGDGPVAAAEPIAESLCAVVMAQVQAMKNSATCWPNRMPNCTSRSSAWA